MSAAEQAFRTALRIDPSFVPAYVNLADVFRLAGRDPEGEAVLREGLELAPEAAALHHALGLLLVRLQRTGEALGELERAATLAPDEIVYAYVYGVALNSVGSGSRALEVLVEAHRRAPADRSVLQALATIHRDRGNPTEALLYARKLLELMPEDAGIAQLVRQLETGS